jgi:conjugal transfer pilus assembly protein TraV
MKKLTLFAPLFLAGCSLTGGNSDFACDPDTDGVSCMSAAEVYELTERPGPVTDDRVEAHEQAQQAQANADDGAAAPEPVPGVRTPSIDSPMPIRTPSKVMRIWVAPWESENGDLNVTGLVYTEIEQRRWNIGVEEARPSTNIRPLQTRSRGPDGDASGGSNSPSPEQLMPSGSGSSN